MKKQNLSVIVRLVLSVVLLLLLLTVIDRDALLKAIVSIDVSIYLAGLLAYFGAITFWAVRWNLFIRAASEPVNFGRAFATLLMGIFYSMFLPTIVGTDIGRMYELSREEETNNAKVVSTVLLDRLVGLITIAILGAVALVIGYSYTRGDSSIVLFTTGVLVVLVVGWMLFFNRKFMQRLEMVFRLPVVNRLESSWRELYEALYHLHNQPRLLVSALAVSLLFEVVEVVSVIFAATALDIQVQPTYFFIFMPIIWLVTVLPISISGLGLREGAFAFFLTQVGVPASDAVVVSLIYYSYSVVVGVMGGFTLLRFAVADYLQRAAKRSA